MSSVYGLNFWQYNGYFGDNMNRSEFGTADNDNASRGGHTYVEQEETTKSGCPTADAGGSGQTIGEPWSYINWQSNISDTYTRVWWGWFVPSYSGTLWLQTASDDSSLVYVSEDEFGQPTKSSNRTDVKTAAGGFSAITLVVNNGGTHGRNYRSGSMTVVANKSYFIRIYMGENGGGDNMIFSWNDTGDPANSTSNTMSYVKLDGSQSDKVLFYYNNPVQAKESNAPVDVSLGIVSWYDGASYDTSNSVWIDKAGTIDLCGNRLVGNIKTKSYLVNDSTLVSNRNNKKYIQKAFPTYLSGDKNSGISFSYDPSSQFLTDGSYTFFHVARRDPSDVNQTGRVFDGSGVNWYSGFNDASSGVAQHENDVVNTIDKDYGTSWVVSVDTPKYYRSVGYSDTSNGYYETSSGIRNDTNTTTPPISIHYGSNTFQTPISTGGVVTNYSNYSINTFLSSGTLNITRNTTADFLIVGGGGGGGGQTHIGGGGGAGGVVIATNQSLAAGSYNVVVGNGGKGALIINPPAANGGLTNTYTDNNIEYNSFTFLSNGTFNVTSEGYFDFIIVGAGGSGGSHWGGGGGGGGVIIGTSQMLTTGSYTITVGTGSGQTGQNAQGADGNDSSIVGNNINLVAKGGGGGGWDTNNSRNGRNGGSGGGGADESCIGGSAIKSDGTVFTGGSVSLGDNITLYGNVGGSQSAAAGVYWPQRGMGGGGAGGPGEGVTQNGSPNHNKGPSGGIGIQNNFRTGSNVYYAGGGGGPAHTNYPQYVTVGGDGGLGGGGNGDWHGTNNGTAGAANTGGGGGGGSYQGTGESGGSGIVIIRYSNFTQNNYALNGTDSSFNGFIAKGGGGGGTGNYVDAIRSTDVSGGTETQYSIGNITYQVHSFTQTGANTLTITKPIIADYMLIGGGGGGRGRHGGGGGAGGVIIGTSQTLPIGTYTINIGSGGQGGDYSDPNNTIGYDGSNTEIIGNINLKAKGGGGGGAIVSTQQFVNIVNGDFSDETASNDVYYNLGDTFKNGEWRWGAETGGSHDLRVVRYRSSNHWVPIYPNATSNNENNPAGDYYHTALIKSYGGYLEQQLTVVPGNTYNIKYWVGPRVDNNSVGSGSPPGSNQTVATGHTANGCKVVLVEGSTQTELGAQTLNSALGPNQYYNQYRQFSLPFTPTVSNPWVRFVQNHGSSGDKAVFFTNIELELTNELPSDNGNDGGSGGGATYGNSAGNSKYYTSFNIADIVSWSQKGNYIYGSDNYDKIGGYKNTSIPRESIALNDDGTIIAIGSEHHSSNSGHVRIFQFSNNIWSQMGQDINGGSGDGFGSTVSINGSGDTVIIGGNKSNGRYAAVYKWNNSSWSIMDSNITGPGGSSSDEAFGWSVDINNEGNIIAISAPNHSHSSGGSRCGLIKIYEWNGSSWNQKGTSIYGQDYDYMGKDISLSDDGLLIVAGGTNTNNADDSKPGIVRIYYWNDTLSVPDWTQQGTDLIGENLSGGATAYNEIRSQMGGCGGLKISGDGKTLSVHYRNGNDHHIRTFTWNGTAWIKDTVDLDGEQSYDLFGGAISMNKKGTLMVTGALYYAAGSATGKVYIYKRENNAWIKIKEILDEDWAGFTGSSVTMNSDGFVISYSSPNTDTNGNDRGTVTTYNTLDSLGNILGQETDLDGGSAVISTNIIAYGNDGGVGQNNGYWPSGGGGGAGGVGGTPSTNQQSPGDGGIGIQNSFLTNSNIYYAGGGGASSKLTDTGGSSGGNGGGGDGKAVGGGNGGDALANTGGGGGGAGGDAYRGGHGGSGYAVVRFAYNDLAEKGDADNGGSGGGGGGNYLAGPSYPGGNDGTDGGSSSQDTYSSITNVTGYGNSGGGFTGIPASGGDDAGGGGGGAGGAGNSRSPNGGGTGNGGIGIQNNFRTNSMVYYAGGGGGGSGSTSTPGTGGSSVGGSGSNSSSVPSSAVANSGSGGGGGNSAVNGGNGADGIVVVRVTDSPPAQQCEWNVAEVISYNRILDATEENKVFNYLKNRYLGTQQSSTNELYQLPGDIEGGDMIRGFPPEFPLHQNIIGWYTNDSYEYDTSGVWSDISPFRHNLTATLNNTPITSDSYTDKIEKKINDIHPQLSYIKGNNEVGFNFPSSILPDSSYTLIYVARKPIDGTDVSGRIIDSKTNANFYSGFIGTKTGVAFHST